MWRQVPVLYLLAGAVLALGIWTQDPMATNIVIVLVAFGTLQLVLRHGRRP